MADNACLAEARAALAYFLPKRRAEECILEAVADCHAWHEVSSAPVELTQ
jgi:hypothetical protein